MNRMIAFYAKLVLIIVSIGLSVPAQSSAVASDESLLSQIRALLKRIGNTPVPTLRKSTETAIETNRPWSGIWKVKYQLSEYKADSLLVCEGKKEDGLSWVGVFALMKPNAGGAFTEFKEVMRYESPGEIKSPRERNEFGEGKWGTPDQAFEPDFSWSIEATPKYYTRTSGFRGNWTTLILDRQTLRIAYVIDPEEVWHETVSGQCEIGDNSSLLKAYSRAWDLHTSALSAYDRKVAEKSRSPDGKI